MLKIVLCDIFVKLMQFYQDSLTENSNTAVNKNQITDCYKKNEIFCNIINVFTVTFDQFNASLLNKII